MKNTRKMKPIYFVKTILVSILIAAVGTISAEPINKGNISGKVIDKQSKQPIPFAAVSLAILPDTTIKKSVITDVNGGYTFNQVSDGRYVVSARMVGYEPKHSRPIACKQNTIKMEDLMLENNAVLQAVTVSTKRPEIEQKADRTVLNVENSTTASGENAYEVLRKAPGINIDKDDNISLKGKQGIMVTINDKPTYLSGQELANYLKTLHGTEIEKVELISSPPARYEAAGNTGIINIKLKRNNKVGVNGTANAGLTYTNKMGGNAGVSLNMRKGKINTFGSFNGRKGYYKNTLFLDRKTNTDISQLIQNGKGGGDYDIYNFRAGVDYELNKRHTFGVMARGSKYREDGDLDTRTDLFLRDGSLTKYLNSSSIEDNNNNNYTLNANYKMTIDTVGRSLNVDIDYVEYRNRSNQHNDTYYFKPSGETFSPALLLKNQTPSDIYIKSFRVDYTHPFTKGMMLETGVKGSTVSSDNDLKYDKYNYASSTWEVDNERSNHFKFDESILAGYASLSYDKNSWSIKGGLRAEQTWSKGNSISINKITKRDYLDIFPTLFIQKTINESNSVNISYNRRIDRPNYDKLNPFVFRIDEYTYKEGNPYLKPQYTDNIELTHAWKNKVFTSLGYSHTKDVQNEVLEEVTDPNNPQAIKATKIYERNIDELNSFTLNVSANLNPISWFRTNNNITAMYNDYKRGNQQSGNSKLMYMIYSSNSFILPKQYIFEIMGTYNSAMAYGLIDLKPRYGVNIGLQKKFLDNKLTAKVSVDDVFKTINSKAIAKYDGMDLYTKSTWASQRISLSLTYRFGSKDVKAARQRSTSSEEELNRTGNGK
jgi:hypothetical protein